MRSARCAARALTSAGYVARACVTYVAHRDKIHRTKSFIVCRYVCTTSPQKTGANGAQGGPRHRPVLRPWIRKSGPGLLGRACANVHCIIYPQDIWRHGIRNYCIRPMDWSSSILDLSPAPGYVAKKRVALGCIEAIVHTTSYKTCEISSNIL